MTNLQYDWWRLYTTNFKPKDFHLCPPQTDVLATLSILHHIRITAGRFSYPITLYFQDNKLPFGLMADIYNDFKAPKFPLKSITLGISHQILITPMKCMPWNIIFSRWQTCNMIDGGYPVKPKSYHLSPSQKDVLATLRFHIRFLLLQRDVHPFEHYIFEMTNFL
jgi:hypothetical protein